MRAAAAPWADAEAIRLPAPPSRDPSTPARCERLPPTERADVRPANVRPPEMHPAAACPEAYSAAVPAKPAAMSAKASEVSATTMPTATAAVSPAASVAIERALRLRRERLTGELRPAGGDPGKRFIAR
jgi:hypothetical protein